MSERVSEWVSDDEREFGEKESRRSESLAKERRRVRESEALCVECERGRGGGREGDFPARQR